MGTVKRPCMKCSGWALPGKSYCANCGYTQDRKAKGRRAKAPGNGAAGKVRRYLRAYPGESFRCRKCSKAFRPAELEVDHVLPLSDGGHDIDQNIQLLCIGCHKDKTRQENSQRAKGRN